MMAGYWCVSKRGVVLLLGTIQSGEISQFRTEQVIESTTRPYRRLLYRCRGIQPRLPGINELAQWISRQQRSTSFGDITFEQGCRLITRMPRETSITLILPAGRRVLCDHIRQPSVVHQAPGINDEGSISGLVLPSLERDETTVLNLTANSRLSISRGNAHAGFGLTITMRFGGKNKWLRRASPTVHF